jgi:hypothetical protein
MMSSRDVEDEMRPFPLDPNTADALLSGVLGPEDAPPGYSEVAALLHAVKADPSPGEFARKSQAISAMAAAVGSHSVGGVLTRSRRSTMFKLKIAAALVAASMTTGTGLAFAGALPGPAQNVASTVLAKVGVSVPRHGNGPDVSGPARHGLCTAYASGQGGTSGKKNSAVPFKNLQEAAQAAGQTVDEFCTGATPGGPPSSGKPPVTTPNPGGTGTANTASNGASEKGTTNADAKSQGHSSAGSGNRHKP